MARGLGADEVLLHNLLGDGGTALRGTAAQVLENGPHDGRVIDPTVRHEVGVFGSEDRTDDQVGDFVEGDRLTVPLRQLAEQNPVGRVQLG